MPKFYYVKQEVSSPEKRVFEIADPVLAQLHNEPNEELLVYYHNGDEKRVVANNCVYTVSLSEEDILNLLTDSEMCDIFIKYDLSAKMLLFVLRKPEHKGFAYRCIHSDETSKDREIKLLTEQLEQSEYEERKQRDLIEKKDQEIKLYETKLDYAQQTNKLLDHLVEQGYQNVKMMKEQVDQKEQENRMLVAKLEQSDETCHSFQLL